MQSPDRLRKLGSAFVGASLLFAGCRPQAHNPYVDIREIPVTPTSTRIISSNTIPPYPPNFGETIQKVRQAEIIVGAATQDEIRLEIIDTMRQLIHPSYQGDIRKDNAYKTIIDRTTCVDQSCNDTVVNSGLSEVATTAQYMQLEGVVKQGKITSARIAGIIDMLPIVGSENVITSPDLQQVIPLSLVDQVARTYFSIPSDAFSSESQDVSNLIGVNGNTRVYLWRKDNTQYCLEVDASGRFKILFTDKNGAFTKMCDFITQDQNGNNLPVSIP